MPEKLKLRPGISPSEKGKRSVLPSLANLSINGPPGYGKPISLAVLSKASPTASSCVSPMTSMSSADFTQTNCVWPPLTVRQRKGKEGLGSSIKCANTCACI